MSPSQASDLGPGSRSRRRRTLVVVVVAVVLLLAGGGAAVLALTGDEPEGGSDAASSTTPEEGPTGGVAVPTTVVRVAGELRPAAERRLAKEVRSLVEEYVADAYVDKRTGFPGFSDKARRLARRDADVTTGRRLGGGEVELRSGRVRVSVLSPRPRQPVGATAAVRLVLDSEAGPPRGTTVTGQLLLTPSARGWRVFGYDLAMSGVGDGRSDR
jgi:hypothetical protein